MENFTFVTIIFDLSKEQQVSNLTGKYYNLDSVSERFSKMKTSVNRDPEPCDKIVQQKYNFRSRQSLEPPLHWMAFFEESSTTKNFGGNRP